MTPQEDIGHLPAHILWDLARNDSASPEYRRAAMELMLDHKFKEADHPELGWLKADVLKARAAKDEVEAIVETAIESPITNSGFEIDHPVSGQGDSLLDMTKVDALHAAIGEAKQMPMFDQTKDTPSGPLSASVTTKTLFQ